MTAAGAGLLALGWAWPARLVLGAAAFLAVLAVVAPGVVETLDRASVRLGRAIGTGVGAVVLTLIYHSVFLAGGAWLRLRGGDPLHRRFPVGGTSNWVEREGFGVDRTLYAKQWTRPHGSTPRDPVTPGAGSAARDPRARGARSA